MKLTRSQNLVQTANTEALANALGIKTNASREIISTKNVGGMSELEKVADPSGNVSADGLAKLKTKGIFGEGPAVKPADTKKVEAHIRTLNRTVELMKDVALLIESGNFSAANDQLARLLSRATTVNAGLRPNGALEPGRADPETVVLLGRSLRTLSEASRDLAKQLEQGQKGLEEGVFWKGRLHERLRGLRTQLMDAMNVGTRFGATAGTRLVETHLAKYCDDPVALRAIGDAIDKHLEVSTETAASIDNKLSRFCTHYQTQLGLLKFPGGGANFSEVLGTDLGITQEVTWFGRLTAHLLAAAGSEGGALPGILAAPYVAQLGGLNSPGRAAQPQLEYNAGPVVNE